jgi:hypothetical protein
MRIASTIHLPKHHLPLILTTPPPSPIINRNPCIRLSITSSWVLVPIVSRPTPLPHTTPTPLIPLIPLILRLWFRRTHISKRLILRGSLWRICPFPSVFALVGYVLASPTQTMAAHTAPRTNFDIVRAAVCVVTRDVAQGRQRRWRRRLDEYRYGLRRRNLGV